MKKQKLWMNIVSNLAMASLVFSVALVCFAPDDAVATATEEKLYRRGYSESGVSLMFNVYWGTEEVYQILDVLDAYEAKSTFFIGGSWADDNVQCLKEIAARGHEIGNHGYFHKDHKKLNYDQNEQEIRLTEVMVKALVGVKPTLFAPPSGSFSKTTLQVAEQLGYTVIMWTKDTIDWRDSDKDLIYKRATKNPSNGDLILMHPKQHSLNVLPKIIEFYVQNGYEIVTVSENLS